MSDPRAHSEKSQHRDRSGASAELRGVPLQSSVALQLRAAIDGAVRARENPLAAPAPTLVPLTGPGCEVPEATEPESSPEAPAAHESLESPESRDALEGRVHGRALRFLMRGVVHKMNNVLSVFMSLTQMIEIKGPSASPIRKRQDVQPYRESVESGRAVMQLLCDLMPESRIHEADRTPLCVGPFLQLLSQTLLCESHGTRYHVKSSSEPQLYVAHSRRELGSLLLLLLEHVLLEGSACFQGGLRLDAKREHDAIRLDVSFELPSDHLPFDVAARPVDAELAGYCALLGVELRSIERGHGYTLRLRGS